MLFGIAPYFGSDADFRIFASARAGAIRCAAVRRKPCAVQRFAAPHTFYRKPCAASQVRMIPPAAKPKKSPARKPYTDRSTGQAVCGGFYFKIMSGNACRQSSPEIGHTAKHAVRGDQQEQPVQPGTSAKPTGRSSVRGIISRLQSRTRIRSPRSRYRRFRTRRSSARFLRSQEPKTAR